MSNRINFAAKFHALFIAFLFVAGSATAAQMPTTTNPFINPLEVETARLELSERTYRQEYLAEFIMLEKVHSYLKSELTPGSKALHELHCFLVAQIEYIDFDELDMGTKVIPRYQIGKLKIKARYAARKNKSCPQNTPLLKCTDSETTS